MSTLPNAQILQGEVNKLFDPSSEDKALQATWDIGFGVAKRAITVKDNNWKVQLAALLIETGIESYAIYNYTSNSCKTLFKSLATKTGEMKLNHKQVSYKTFFSKPDNLASELVGFYYKDNKLICKFHGKDIEVTDKKIQDIIGNGPLVDKELSSLEESQQLELLNCVLLIEAISGNLVESLIPQISTVIYQRIVGLTSKVASSLPMILYTRYQEKKAKEEREKQAKEDEAKALEAKKREEQIEKIREGLKKNPHGDFLALNKQQIVDTLLLNGAKVTERSDGTLVVTKDGNEYILEYKKVEGSIGHWQIQGDKSKPTGTHTCALDALSKITGKDLATLYYEADEVKVRIGIEGRPDLTDQEREQILQDIRDEQQLGGKLVLDSLEDQEMFTSTLQELDPSVQYNEATHEYSYSNEREPNGRPLTRQLVRDVIDHDEIVYLELATHTGEQAAQLITIGGRNTVRYNKTNLSRIYIPVTFAGTETEFKQSCDHPLTLAHELIHASHVQNHRERYITERNENMHVTVNEREVHIEEARTVGLGNIADPGAITENALRREWGLPIRKDYLHEHTQHFPNLKDLPDLFITSNSIGARSRRSSTSNLEGTNIQYGLSSTNLTCISGICSSFYEYTMEGIGDILGLRIGAEASNIELTNTLILPETYIFSEKYSNINALLFNLNLYVITLMLRRNRYAMNGVNQSVILAPISLYGKHAVGVMFVVQEDGSGYKAFYLDPENTTIPEGLAAIFKESGYEIDQLPTEGQRYTNCGPEVIENFMLYLTGERLSQEDAIVHNSRLVEEELMAEGGRAEENYSFNTYIQGSYFLHELAQRVSHHHGVNQAMIATTLPANNIVGQEDMDVDEVAVNNDPNRSESRSFLAVNNDQELAGQDNDTGSLECVDTNKLYSKANELFEEGWLAEASDEEEAAQIAELRFLDAMQLYADAIMLDPTNIAYQQAFNIVSLKIDGNNLFNEGLELADLAYQLQEQLLWKTQAPKANELIISKYLEVMSFYQAAYHKFAEGLTLSNDLRFASCMELVEQSVNMINETVDSLERLNLETLTDSTECDSQGLELFNKKLMIDTDSTSIELFTHDNESDFIEINIIGTTDYYINI